MDALTRCVEGCCRLYKDKPLCKVCRETLGAPYGMSFNRYAVLARSVGAKTREVTEAMAAVYATKRNQTYRYMRVRDRVGINSATPTDLLAICRSHATAFRDPMVKGTHTPQGWE